MDVYKNTNPAITVIMVTYNRAGYLHRAIQSFLNQTVKDNELIIVDDGSTDNTFDIVCQFMNHHPNIRYMRHTNRNISLSKNAGILNAVGKYITFLDSDDEYKPDYLAKRYAFMEAHPEIDMLEGGVIIIGNPYVKDRNNPDLDIHLSQCHIGATFFAKSTVFTELDGYDKEISYSEDSAFWIKANQKYKIHKFDEPGYIYYRNTPGSICNTI
ncbi:MAG: glycosyltransferase family 2 protein [Saprospiraceae bacterium]|nr:glycosyltransferase family 2 protein [Saprospiraceae bacterium]